MRNTTALLLVGIAFACTDPTLAAETSDEPPREMWMSAPSVSIMTGFIYEPRKPYPIERWTTDLGDEFDAEQWVADFRSLGATHLVFYDKWIDGLVFHDTKTTGFKTDRDFLRPLAAACQQGELPLVLYFNAVSDGNPEFDPWALLDRQGKPIVFGSRWPTRYQTLHSPFREKAVEQVRELLTNHGPIHGIWHDIFSERLNTNSPWTAQGYERMFDQPFDKASPARLAEFNARTLADYLDEIETIRRDRGQTQCLFTSNGSGGRYVAGGVWTEHVGSRMQYFFNEGHGFQRNDQLARMARVLPGPLNVNLLLNSSWFAPLEDTPPPSHLTNEQAVAASAIVLCQGAGINLALTPGHSGKFGEDLQRARAVGAWFKEHRPWLVDTQPVVDVAVVSSNQVETLAAESMLVRAGFFSRWLPADQPTPTSVRAILIPARTRLTPSRIEQLRRYLNAGGTLVGLGEQPDCADLFGVRFSGRVALPKKTLGVSVQTDSEYDDQYVANHLLDDKPTAWASGDTPMPHWAVITLAEPTAVQTVELTSRAGEYLVTDLDVELPDGDGWRVAKSVRNAEQRTIIVSLDEPVSTDRVRVTILRELYQGNDRQYADVESIRVLDPTGRNHASAKIEPARMTGTSAEFDVAFDDSVSIPPSAVAVEPTTAEVLARFDDAANSPAILCNRSGRGRAFLMTADSDVHQWDEPVAVGLGRLVFGEPTFRVHREDARRFRFLMGTVGTASVLHVIDSAVPGPGLKYSPQAVEVSLLSERLGGVRDARLVGATDPLPLTPDGPRIHLSVTPNPVATVILNPTPTRGASKASR